MVTGFALKFKGNIYLFFFQGFSSLYIYMLFIFVCINERIKIILLIFINII